MVYIMTFQVDGCCRGNGRPGSRGAAACVLLNRYRHVVWTMGKVLPSHPTPTNQRAELLGIIMALQEAAERYQELNISTDLHLVIESDSKYAINCMTTWVTKWENNGWINAAGNDVANEDLLKEALGCQEAVQRYGTVTYKWIPRDENEAADTACNQALDEDSNTSSDDDSDW